MVRRIEVAWLLVSFAAVSIAGCGSGADRVADAALASEAAARAQVEEALEDVRADLDAATRELDEVTSERDRQQEIIDDLREELEDDQNSEVSSTSTPARVKKPYKVEACAPLDETQLAMLRQTVDPDNGVVAEGLSAAYLATLANGDELIVARFGQPLDGDHFAAVWIPGRGRNPAKGAVGSRHMGYYKNDEPSSFRTDNFFLSKVQDISDNAANNVGKCLTSDGVPSVPRFITREQYDSFIVDQTTLEEVVSRAGERACDRAVESGSNIVLSCDGPGNGVASLHFADGVLISKAQAGL